MIIKFFPPSQYQQLQDNLAASERSLAEMEEHHTARLQSVEEDLVQKIHQAEVDLQSAVAQSEGYKKSQEELKVWQDRMCVLHLPLKIYIYIFFASFPGSPLFVRGEPGTEPTLCFCKPVTI